LPASERSPNVVGIVGETAGLLDPLAYQTHTEVKGGLWDVKCLSDFAGTHAIEDETQQVSP